MLGGGFSCTEAESDWSLEVSEALRRDKAVERLSSTAHFFVRIRCKELRNDSMAMVSSSIPLLVMVTDSPASSNRLTQPTYLRTLK